MGLSARGFSDMHVTSIAPIQCGGDALLAIEGLTQRQPTLMNSLGLALQASGVHKVVGQHADEQMPLNAPFNLVVDRTQTRFGLEAAKHRLQLGQHRVGTP